MKSCISGLLLSAVVALPAVAADEIPTPQEIVDRMIAAAGGSAFSELGVLKLEVESEETRNDGTSGKMAYTVYVDTAHLGNQRMELPGNVVVGHHGGGGWSTTNGVMDDRPQTSSMAAKTLNQTLFPLLLPYSLEMEGVWVREVRETTLDGRKVWVLALPFVKGFFHSPLLTTTWIMVVAQDDYSIISYEFIPPARHRDVSPTGIRYRILKHQEIDGVELASQLLLIGINSVGMESGANRVTKIESSVIPWDTALFLSPAELAALEEED
jgi:hypothetical protein